MKSVSHLLEKVAYYRLSITPLLKLYSKFVLATNIEMVRKCSVHDKPLFSNDHVQNHKCFKKSQVCIG